MESYIRTATIQEIKQELQTISPAKLNSLCLRLAKYKKENKELLTFLLFEEDDLDNYVASVKKEISQLFTDINSSNLYLARKSIRKILRIAGKHIRYISLSQAEVELLMHFCETLKQSGIPYKKSNALHNLYSQQLKKIAKAMTAMHDDLQYDYQKKLSRLEE